MNKNMYVDVTEVCDDWGVSRAQGYKIIKQLNDRMLAINPNLIVLSGKANRKFYEENCYGMVKQALKRPFSGKRKAVSYTHLENIRVLTGLLRDLRHG